MHISAIKSVSPDGSCRVQPQVRPHPGTEFYRGLLFASVTSLGLWFCIEQLVSHLLF